MRNRNEFVQLIDRYRLGQAQRLSIGLTVRPDFGSVRCSLLLAEGRGKFLRVRWIESRQVQIAPSIAKACRELAASESGLLREFSQLRVDLTRSMASAVNEMASYSGVHSRMLLVVCVDEPGVWIPDYDGKLSWQAFCEPETLAELTGLTVVDALRCRDLATGGRGWPIGPLPSWLMFADRNQTVADKPRLLLDLGQFTQLTWMPESDGLDDELPAIRFSRSLGSDFEQRLCCEAGQPEIAPSQRDEIGAQGKVDLALSRIWNDFELKQDLSRTMPGRQEIENLVQNTKKVMNEGGLSLADVLMTLSSHVATAVKEFVSRKSSGSNYQVVCAGDLGQHGLLLSELNRTLDVDWLNGESMNYEPIYLSSATAAILGLMHIDQMPVTLPWISGCDHPRILGRLTPGNPGNWRRVIMEMGDCRPPVMKLREAV